MKWYIKHGSNMESGWYWRDNKHIAGAHVANLIPNRPNGIICMLYYFFCTIKIVAVINFFFLEKYTLGIINGVQLCKNGVGQQKEKMKDLL